MSFQRVRELLELTAQYCAERGNPCSQQQLHRFVLDYDNLLEATRSHPQALFIFEVLLNEARQKTSLLAWLSGELRFELYALYDGNRSQSARSILNRLSEVSDEALDLYNERMARFTTGRN